MKVVATVQVRMNSSRLPGKVLKKIFDRPILDYLIERLSRANFIDEIVVATSNRPENDPIENYCNDNNLKVFRGSEENVSSRIIGALDECKADIAVEIYGDCPLIDHRIVDQVIEYYLDNLDKFDFVTNAMKTTYSPGLEVEVYNVLAFKKAYDMVNDPVELEHGTYIIRKRPEIFNIKNIEAPDELYYPKIELELDTEEDFFVIKKIIEKLYPHDNDFSAIDAIMFLNDNPNIKNKNKDVHRRWKEFRVEYNQ
jgi:spore coat polysaccharide biosynthesis protein SpsF